VGRNEQEMVGGMESVQQGGVLEEMGMVGVVGLALQGGVEEETGMVGVVDLARQGEMEAEQVDRGRWIVLTVWVENCQAGCSDPYFDYACVHAQNWVHRQRYPHPHRRLWQSRNGLWDQDMAVGCWLVDKWWCLSCDGSWLQLCGCWRNTQNKNEREKREGCFG
jgi:hypothetical protein